MFNLLLVGIGGALGSILRYLTADAIYMLTGRNFTYGTLAVNVIGCCLIGFLSVLLLERYNQYSVELGYLLIIGLLGGYTTFSSFSLETFVLFTQGQFLKAILNITLSVGLCLIATWLGSLFAKQVI